jgi:hypothetical protein
MEGFMASVFHTCIVKEIVSVQLRGLPLEEQ